VCERLLEERDVPVRFVDCTGKNGVPALDIY